MARFRQSKTPSKLGYLQRPAGQFTERVREVGPEHFGVVCFDCAKSSSAYFVADFFGKVLLEPTPVDHTRGDLQAAIDKIRQLQTQHDLRDLVVAIERTGEYHRPVQRAFRATGWDVRLVHPFATKQYRQPANAGNKTEPTDLDAIFRLTTHGFGLIDPVWPDEYVQLQVLARHRRDLVFKHSDLRRQSRESLHAILPGFAECFPRLWQSPVVLTLACHFDSAAAFTKAGIDGMTRVLREAECPHIQSKTLNKILAWALNAPPGHPQPQFVHRVFRSRYDDLCEKDREIMDLERSLAHLVVATPYSLLLAVPGINIVSIADLAGEMGPIHLYRDANAITGRASLMPARYQSDQVDCQGPLRRSGNRRLRAALLQIADNMIRHNHHFAARASLWKGKDARWIRVKLAKIFSRVAYAIVAGQQLFPHPCLQQECYILDKLMAFHHDHKTPPEQLQQDLNAAIAQLPRNRYVPEAKPLLKRLEELGQKKRGPQPLKNIIDIVLARLGCLQVQSESEGERTPG
jgi:transposase